MSGAAAEELSLKFLFANQDGVSVVLRFPRRALVADVKAQLLRHWPPKVAAVDDVRAVRLICMGRGMLQDAQTLEAARVPSFSTHPTPVNVSVLRRSQPAVSAASATQAALPKEVTSANCGCCLS